MIIITLISILIVIVIVTMTIIIPVLTPRSALSDAFCRSFQWA